MNRFPLIRIYGNRILVGDGEFHRTDCSDRTQPAHYTRIVCGAISPNRGKIVTISEEGGLYIWNTAQLRDFEWRGMVQPPLPHCAGISDDGMDVALAREECISIFRGKDRWETCHVTDVHLRSMYGLALFPPIVSLHWMSPEQLLCRDTHGSEVLVEKHNAIWGLAKYS